MNDEDNFLDADELCEIGDLLRFLNDRKHRNIQPDAFKLYDSNGEVIGWITMADHITWVFSPGKGS